MDASAAPVSHDISELGLEHWVDDDVSYGRAEITADMLVPGTDFVRIGLLTTLVDLVAGQQSFGPITPTTDISVHMVQARGLRTVHLESRVLKAGATLVVVETLLAADDEDEPFATALATFMNRTIEVAPRPEWGTRLLDQPLSARIGARVLRPGTVELMPRDDVANAFHGTIQGGVMAIVGELAAESANGDDAPLALTDLDIRFLNRVKVGPARAVAEVVMDAPKKRVLRVAIRDRGNDDRLVAQVSASGDPSR